MITLEDSYLRGSVLCIILTFILVLILIWVHDICRPHMISNTYNFIVKTYHLSSLSKFADRSELISYLDTYVPESKLVV